MLDVIFSGNGSQQGKFLNNMTTENSWPTLRRCWISVYAGAPDYLQSDAGSSVYSEDFIAAADKMGVVLKAVSTEGNERIGKFECAHSILRSVYSKPKIYLPTITK